MFMNIYTNFTCMSIFMIVMFFYIIGNDEYNERMKRYYNKFQEILNNVHLYNPTIIHFYESYDLESELNSDTDSDTDSKKEEVVKKEEEKYEDKYLRKFKEFSNDFFLTDEEKLQIEKEFQKLKDEQVKSYTQKYNEIENKLDKISRIIPFENENALDKENLVVLNSFLEYFDLTDEYMEDPENVDIDEYLESLRSDKNKLQEEYNLLSQNELTNDKLYEKATENIIQKKLDNNINNYIIECTPLGNVFMRYNNDKKSFEYFSNNSIPYRYLEPVGRKYVMTFYCKPIFIDLEEELKKAEERIDNNKNESKQKQDNQSKFKKYNNQDTLKQQLIPKRKQNNFVLPPQIKANLPNVNQQSEKQLLKENANRYTWEGRLSTFNPLKKIDKKLVDKKLSLSFSDFKRLQQNKK